VLLSLFALAVVEIVGFVLVAKLAGVAWTLLLILVSTVLGVWLLRREGLRAWRRFRAAAETGPPGREVTDGLVGLLAAVLLVVPGFLTDLVGLALLVPPVRAAARAGMQRSAERRMTSAEAGDLFGPRRVRVRRGPPGPPGASSTPVIDGEVIEGEVVD
jgi:UPF0716 protein FxsA